MEKRNNADESTRSLINPSQNRTRDTQFATIECDPSLCLQTRWSVFCFLFFKQPHCPKIQKGKTLTNKSLFLDNMKFESFSINQCLKVISTVSLLEKTAAVCSTPKYQMKAQKNAGQAPFLNICMNHEFTILCQIRRVEPLHSIGHWLSASKIYFSNNGAADTLLHYAYD